MPEIIVFANPNGSGKSTITKMANWVDDKYIFDDSIDWERIDYKAFAKILYMGKIYESSEQQ